MSENKFTSQDKQKLLDEISSLQEKLQKSEEKLEKSEEQRQESEEILEAIRTGSIDALTIQGENGPQIFTIKGADHTYRILIEEMNEGALTLNAEAMILYTNARFAEFLSLPLERVIGISFYAFLPLEDHARFGILFKQGWKSKGKGEFVLKSAEGKSLPFSLSMNRLQSSELPAVGMIVTDLLAEKEILEVKSQVEIQNRIISNKEQELLKARQSSEEAARFRMVLEGIPQMAWTNLPSGEFNFFNERWYTYSNLGYEQTKAWGWQQVMHPEDLPSTLEAFAHALNSGNAFVVENRYRRGADGTYRWHLNRALPVRSEEGHIILWIGTATDVHEQKLAEQASQRLTEELAATNEELQSANEEIQASNEELSESNGQLVRINVDLDNFIYTASHDLKAPIVNIEGLMKALVRQLPPASVAEERTGKTINYILESVERFKRTIENLTEVVKLQKENNQPASQIDLNRIVKEVQLDLAPQIKEAAATLVIDTAQCPMIEFSEKNLRSIIYNLLSNAIKYHSPDRIPLIHIGCQQQEQYQLLTVTDNGLGMDLSREKNLFSMFRRLHDHVEGSGIGLYMVKKMIENAGGKIEIESEVGKGSTFKVYFKYPH